MSAQACSSMRSASARTSQKAIALLILAGLLAYANSLTKPFHYDDHFWITDSNSIRDLGAYVASMLNRPFFAFTLYFNYRMHGLHVFGYHLVNVVIHIAAALTLFGIVRRTLLLPRWQGRFADASSGLAFAVALLWMVHPLQTQAVTYIIQRCESMMGLCYFLTIYCTLRGTQAAHPWSWYLTAWFCCVIGAGSKEVMISVLPILVAYDRIFIARWKELLRCRWLFYLAIAAIWIIPVMILLPGVYQTDLASSGFFLPTIPMEVYWMTEAWVLLHYVWLCFIPYPQFFSYRDWPLTREFSDFWPAGLAIGCLLLLTRWLLSWYPWLGFLGLWFFGILSITSVVPLLDVAFEHRLYLPLAAIVVLVVVGGYQCLRALFQQNLRVVLGTLATLVVGLVLLCLTVRRNEDYRSEYRLWASVCEWNPDNSDALYTLARAYEADEKFGLALEYYEKCMKPELGIARASFYHGGLLCRLDQPKKGFKQQLEWINALGSAPGPQYDVGKAYWILGKRKEAEQHFRHAVQLAPHMAGYHAALALVLHEQNRAEEARFYYDRALSLDAAWPHEARRLAVKYLQRYPCPSAWTRKEALFHAEQAAQGTDCQDPLMVDALVEAYAANGLDEHAEQLFRRASQTWAAKYDTEWQDQISRTIAYYRATSKK